MLVFNDWCSITCQSCCCTLSKVDPLHKAGAVECTHFMSHKCSCKLPACSQDADRLRETVASGESSCQSSQLQEGADVVHAAVLSCTSGSSCVRCTCSTESQLSGSVSVPHRNACVCRRRSKPPENLVHFVRHGQSVNDVRADLNHTQPCCTCIRDLGMSSCHRGVMLSNITASLCPRCTKFAQVKKPEERNSWLTSRHSDTDLYNIQEDQEKTFSHPRHVQTGSIMDVREWQRRHIEQLDRQKLEVYVTLSVSEVCCLKKS